MVKKNERTKASERIEKAKRAYGLAEEKTDSLLTRFAALLQRLVLAPYTFAILIVVLLCIAGAWWQWG